MSTSSTELMEWIRGEYARNFGKASFSYTFGSEPVKPSAFGEPVALTVPAQLEIYVWHPDAQSDLTCFATNGMSSVSHKLGNNRTELLFWVKGKPEEALERRWAEFLANLSLFPFFDAIRMNWWTSFRLDQVLPGYKLCNAVVMHPPFAEEGWAKMESPFADVGDISLLNVVPITEEEAEIKERKGYMALQDLFYERKVDLFSLR